MARSFLIQMLALVLALAVVLPQAAQTAQPHPCVLNPQTDSTCQPSLLPTGAAVTINASGETGHIWGYYLEGSGSYVYVVLLDSQQGGLWVGRFVAPGGVAPR